VLFGTNVYASKWTEYTSENFTIYSDEPKKDAFARIKKFETFRLAALSYTKMNTRPENAKTRIFVFAKHREFKKFGGKRIAGYYINSWDGPRMVMGPGNARISVDSILYHEYFHYLLRERSSEVRFPKWYNEGFAELLSTAEIAEDSVSFGTPPADRAIELGKKRSLPMPLKDLLKPKPPKSSLSIYWSNFYATAWLFTHYVQLGYLAGYPDYSEKARRYVGALNAGRDPLTIFSYYFDKNIQEMEEELKRYKREVHLGGLRFKVKAYDGKIIARQIPENEGISVLSDLAWKSGKDKLALRYLQKNRPSKSFAAKNFTLVAILENRAGNKELAISAANKAQRAGLKSAEENANIAQYFFDVLEKEKSNSIWSERTYKNVVKFSSQAISIDATYMPGYQYLWKAHQLKQARIEAIKALMGAYQHHANSVPLNMEIGAYLAEGEAPERAIPFLTKVVEASHSIEVSNIAKQLIDTIKSPVEARQSSWK